MPFRSQIIRARDYAELNIEINKFLELHVTLLYEVKVLPREDLGDYAVLVIYQG